MKANWLPKNSSNHHWEWRKLIQECWHDHDVYSSLLFIISHILNIGDCFFFVTAVIDWAWPRIQISGERERESESFYFSKSDVYIITCPQSMIQIWFLFSFFGPFDSCFLFSKKRRIGFIYEIVIIDKWHVSSNILSGWKIEFILSLSLKWCAIRLGEMTK